MLPTPAQLVDSVSSGGIGNVAARDVADGEVALLTLNGEGMIRDCDHGGEAIFGYRRSELTWRPISMLLPELAEFELVQGGQANARLRYFCRIGRHFRAVAKDGGGFACEICLNLLDNTGSGRLSLIVRPALAHATAPGNEYGG